jgi:hypothetical protein
VHKRSVALFMCHFTLVAGANSLNTLCSQGTVSYVGCLFVQWRHPYHNPLNYELNDVDSLYDCYLEVSAMGYILL